MKMGEDAKRKRSVTATGNETTDDDLDAKKVVRVGGGVSNSGLKTTDGAIKSSAGKVYWLSISDTAAGVIQLNDSLNDSGTDVWGITIPADGYAHFIFDPPLEFGTGIYLDVPTGAPDVYIGYI
ncbi:hypothetical protein LCGC14_0848640 [marine sediment metagenome]|uniref:Uncharacterized protein n=1 Tax=marine sediment metagenome TaxID=412755 RepID=A0A0F9SI31_9ZZZZ